MATAQVNYFHFSVSSRKWILAFTVCREIICMLKFIDRRVFASLPIYHIFTFYISIETHIVRWSALVFEIFDGEWYEQKNCTNLPLKWLKNSMRMRYKRWLDDSCHAFQTRDMQFSTFLSFIDLNFSLFRLYRHTHVHSLRWFHHHTHGLYVCEADIPLSMSRCY